MAGGYFVKHLSEIPMVPGETEPVWHAVQHHFGLRAFGVNAFVAPEAGVTLVHAHDERKGGHEEIYVVLEGEAVFTLAGEEVRAPAGTFVAVRDVTVQRSAVAAVAGTTVLAVGAPPRDDFTSTWDPRWTRDVPQA